MAPPTDLAGQTPLEATGLDGKSRWVGLPCIASMLKILAVDGFHTDKTFPIRFGLNLSTALTIPRNPEQDSRNQSKMCQHASAPS
jgi:hypothetical protein